jgi:hypothetical protein
VSDIGEALREQSVGGDSAGRIEADKYGVVHRDNIDTRALSQTVEEIIQHATPGTKPIHVMADTVTLDESGLDEQESARAVLYTINKFCEKQEGKFSIGSLSDGCKAMFDETMRTALHLQLRGAGIPHTEVLNARNGTDYPMSNDDLQAQLGLFTDFVHSVAQN